jgi:DNA-binding NarL/FixJ family response regulator
MAQNSPPTRIRVVTADDHPIFRDGLRRLLDSEPEFEVVGEAGCGAEALRLVAHLKPDVLLVDLAMPDMTGLDVLRTLSEAQTPVKAVLLTASADRQQMVEALMLGARGLVLKDSATELLYKCIRCVHNNEYWFGRDRFSDVLAALRRTSTPSEASPAATLTRRELQIVSAIVAGASNRDVATQLGVTEQTVKNHLSSIFDKVGVSNRLELALYAIHHKVTERP